MPRRIHTEFVNDDEFAVVSHSASCSPFISVPPVSLFVSSGITLGYTRSTDVRGEPFLLFFSKRTPLYTGGHLKIPPGVTVVHADSGDGIVNPLSLSLAQAGDGLYFHLAVEGGKQTTENIPPARIFDTIGKFVKKNATKIVRDEMMLYLCTYTTRTHMHIRTHHARMHAHAHL